MKSFKFLLSVSCFLFAVAIGQGLALGQVFVFEATATGTEYCGDGNFEKINAKVFVKVDQTNNLFTVSDVPTFDSEETMAFALTSYSTTGNRAAFLADVLFEDGSYTTVQGTTNSDSKGELKSFKATFIGNFIPEWGCFESGTVTSGKRRKDLE